MLIFWTWMGKTEMLPWEHIQRNGGLLKELFFLPVFDEINIGFYRKVRLHLNHFVVFSQP